MNGADLPTAAATGQDDGSDAEHWLVEQARLIVLEEGRRPITVS